jgi:hypothetical protein
VLALSIAGAIACAALLASARSQPARVPADAELAALQQPAGLWSAPLPLSHCPAEPSARVVFPSSGPAHATGPGAIVWSASPACPGGAGARVAPIGAEDVPGESAIPRDADDGALELTGPLLASGAPHGQIAIAGSSAASSAIASSPATQTRGDLLIQGTAGGPFEALTNREGTAAPVALATAYLGDLAVASAPAHEPAPAGTRGATGALDLRVERFFASRLSPGTLVSKGGSGPVQSLLTTMDYRSEVLVVWCQAGAIYARLVPNIGRPARVQRLASVGAHASIAALVSDDRRGIVAWAEQRGSETSVYVDRSALGVRFGKPELLERFEDPDGLPSPAASPELIRLSSESVMLAWAGASAGHWVVRVAPVDLNGVGEVSTISAPGADALLADLAPGPVDDALLLWTEPSPSAGGAPDVARQALYAAHGFNLYPPARAVFGESELVAPPAHVGDASVAFDPNSDGAVAAWQGEAGAIEYSIRK